MTFEKRSDIPQKYTWDLTAIYETEQGFFDELKKAQELTKQVSQYKGKLNNKWLK